MAVQKRYRQKAVMAAQMFAAGYSHKQVAKELGVNEVTVVNWMKDPTVMEDYRACVRSVVVPAYAKAVNVLAGQMDREDLPWLQQNAARTFMDKYASAVMGEDERDVVIRFEMGQQMPDIGVPQAPTDDE